MANESSDDREPTLHPVVDVVLRAVLALVCGYLIYLQTENFLIGGTAVPVSFILFKIPSPWSDYW